MIFNTLFSNFTHRVASHATILHAMVPNFMCACFKLRENQKTFFQYFFELIFRNTAALFKVRSLYCVLKLKQIARKGIESLPQNKISNAYIYTT